MVDRLHSKLFEAAALDLDRRTRFHFVGQNVRPGYLKKIERDLQVFSKPDVEGEIHFMTQVVESGVEIRGRLFGLKWLVKRILRPYLAHASQVHQLLIQRIAEQHESLSNLAESLAEQSEKLRGEHALLADGIRAELPSAIGRRRASPWLTPPARSRPGAAGHDSTATTSRGTAARRSRPRARRRAGCGRR